MILTNNLRTSETLEVTMPRPGNSINQSTDLCIDAHRAFWRSQGIQVVIIGEPLPQERVRAFLLLDVHELCLFDSIDVLRHVKSARNHTVLVDVRSYNDADYVEMVETDEDEQLKAIRRIYSNVNESKSPVYLTTNATLARRWALSHSRRDALLAIRREAGPHGCAPHPIAGRVFDVRIEADRAIFLTKLLDNERVVQSILPTLKQRDDNIWIDERASVDRGARLAGPLWIGPDAIVPRDDVLIGPGAVGTLPFVETMDLTLRQWRRRRPEFAFETGYPKCERHRYSKRVFDIAFSATVLLLISPLIPLIMLAIWLEDGRPIFFSHTRQTAGGRNFVCYKFRTMCRNAQYLQASLEDRNICDGPQFHIENDPRLLKVGKWLRRFHLDELPQFFNVLLGQMHVIGPRPSPDQENQFCPAWREARLSVKAGITGLWQVRRTRIPNLDYQEWVRYDLEYVEKQSWRLDLRILFDTTWNVVRQLWKRSSRASNSLAISEQKLTGDLSVASAERAREIVAESDGVRNPIPISVGAIDEALDSDQEGLRMAA